MKNMIYLILLVILLSSCGNNNNLIKSESISNTNNDSLIKTDVKNDRIKSSNIQVSFKSYDLDGKELISDDLFKNNKITLVNFWGTTCPPCVYEMPELEKLSNDLKEKECGVIGIITDGDVYPDDAKVLIKTTGVTYPNICLNQEIYNIFPIQVTPTTFFIDNKGYVIGEPIFGARDEENYMVELEKHLELLDK